MGELGDKLRQARESLGLTLVEAEEATRIRRAFLQALEEERYKELPAHVYTKGFIRNYAAYLGLDAEELVASFQRGHQQEAASIPMVLDEPLTRRGPSRMGRALLLGFVAVLVLALIGWYAYNRWHLGVDLLAPLWGEAARPTVTRVATTVAPPPTGAATATAVQQEARPTATLEVAPSVTPTAASPTPRPATPTRTPTVTAAPSPSPTARVFTGVSVTVRTIAASYLDVQRDGQQDFVGTLEAGQERTWTADQAIELLVGNAGGVEVVVNGVPVPALGTAGQVVTVRYTLDSLPRP